MKIAVIANAQFPIAEPFTSGIEQITHLLCSHLQNAGHEIDLYAHPLSDSKFNLVPFPHHENPLPCRADYIPAQAFPDDHYIRQTEIYGRALHKISRGNYDLVHNLSLNDIAIMQGNRLKVPFITTFHTPPFPNLQNGIMAIKPSINQTFSVVSENLADLWYPLIGKSTVIHSGIDLKRWTFSGKTSGKSAFWSGRICQHKAPHEAILAAQKAGLHLNISGPIEDENYYSQYIEPYVHYKSVTYLGHLRQEALNEVLGNSAVAFFTSSWNEPYDLLMSEALACGTPIVAYNTSATPDIVTEDCGILVETGKWEDLAEAASNAILFNREKCYERAMEYCDSNQMIQQYLELYEKVAYQMELQPMDSV